MHIPDLRISLHHKSRNMRVINKIMFSRTEPPYRDVIWAKPIEGGFTFYLFDGRWKPMKVVSDHGTPSTDDDTPWEGGEGQLGPNTVGTGEIIDGSIRREDLNREVSDKLDDTYVEDNESLYINGTKPA
jgi:hypothetical protein